MPEPLGTRIVAFGFSGITNIVLARSLGPEGRGVYAVAVGAASARTLGEAAPADAAALPVVYAVMLELGFNRTEFGKAILAACFINDLGTVIALGLIFSPFTFRTLVFVVASVALRGVFDFGQESLVGSVTNRTLFDLRNTFFRRAVRQDVRQLTASGTTELMARFTNDMEQLGNGIKILYGRMVAEPLKAVACLAAACYISWQLTLVFVFLVPAAGYTLYRVSRMMRRAARRVLEGMSAIYKIVREAFDSIRAVKGFTREPHERRRFRAATDEYYRKSMRVIHIDAFANPMIELLGVIGVGLALGAGTYLVVNGETHIFGARMTSQPLRFEALLQLYAFLAATADPIRKLSSVYTKLQTGEAAATRIAHYQPVLVPGILQTADYARELLHLPSGPGHVGAGDEEINRLIAARLRRRMPDTSRTQNGICASRSFPQCGRARVAGPH